MTSENLGDDGFREYNNPRKRRKKTSKVWDEFEQGVDAQGKSIAICKHCHVSYAATRNSGTSHLKRHLEKCSDRPEELRQGDVDDREACVYDMSELRQDIALFLAEGNHAFLTVEEEGFRRMLSKHIPYFVPFGPATAKKDVLDLYVTERDKLKYMLSKVTGRICLTTDNRKSNHTGQQYICVTAHFVDDSWKLQKRILRFRALPPPQDGSSIANEIMMFLAQWNLDDKILSVTVDNATYNDVMVASLKRRLVPRGGLCSGGSLFHIRCCVHILNLIVQNGLTCISPILENIRTLIKVILKSSHRIKEFYECAEKIFHLNVSRKISLDMPIRWNSTFKLLDTALYFEVVFLHLGSSHTFYESCLPSEDEWDKLAVIHEFLKLFYDVTCMFLATKYPTSNLYFKGAWMVQCHLLEARDGPHEYLSRMVEPMISKFSKYWSEYNLYLSCAVILDPRCKVKLVEYCSTKLYGIEEASTRVKGVLDTLVSLFNDYKLRFAGTSPLVSVASPSVSSSGSKDHFDDYDDFRPSSVRPQPKKSQLDMYLDDPPLDCNSELDILEFWHQTSVRYPILARLARDLLTILVSTVASESAFSIGGKTISATRSSLKSKMVQALVCLQDWRRATSNTNEDQERLEDEIDDTIIEEEEVDDEFDDADPFF